MALAVTTQSVLCAHEDLVSRLLQSGSSYESISRFLTVVCEKCVMFGVTHVLAIDGYSRKIVGFITIPKKNPILIYDHLFRLLLRLWNQVWTDHGTEFSLIAKAQLCLSISCQNQSRQPILQSVSRQNHYAERIIWPEINQRINYPIKCVLVDMENNDEINMGEEVTKFCVSWVTIKVIEVAILTFVHAWNSRNSHRIPGPQGGIPNVLALHRNITVLPSTSVPSTPQIIGVHESNGRRLSRTFVYGSDPLCNHLELQALCERDFFHQFPSMTNVFESVLLGNASLLRECIQYFIRITKSFSMLLEYAYSVVSR